MSQQERMEITKQNYTVPLTAIKKNYRLPSFPVFTPVQPETLESDQWEPREITAHSEAISSLNCVRATEKEMGCKR